MKTKIRLAKLSEATSVTRLLNQVTLDLLEKGNKQWGYPWQQDQIVKEVGLGNVNLIVNEPEIIGVFFLRPAPELTYLGSVDRSLYLNHIAIVPEFQGMGLGTKILSHCYDLSIYNQANIFLDCTTSNTKLRGFYEKNRGQFIGDFPKKDYQISLYRLSR